MDDSALHFASTARKEAVLTSKNPRFLGPYSNTQDILVVGDGDLSFSRSLATALGGSRMVATTFDKYHILTRKYDGAEENKDACKRAGAIVLHNIDATKLDLADFDDMSGFHRIIFNFPHVGGIDIKPNQELLRGFLVAAKGCLHRHSLKKKLKPEVHIALRDTPFYNSWQIDSIATEAGYTAIRKIPFDDSALLRYKNQRSAGTKMRAAPSTDNAYVHIYQLREDRERDEVTLESERGGGKPRKKTKSSSSGKKKKKKKRNKFE